MEPNQQEEVRSDLVLPMSIVDLLKVLALGGMFGVMVALGTRVLNSYLFSSLLCGRSDTAFCSSSVLISEISAIVLASALTVVGLVYLRVFRPLLAVLATALALGGLMQMYGSGRWYWVALLLAGLYAIALGLFAWTARLRTFWIALVVMVVLVVLTRLALSI